MRTKDYWEAKHPIGVQLYKGRPLPEGKRYEEDVRFFLTPCNARLQSVLEGLNLIADNIDTTAHNVQQYAVDTLTYTSDETLGHPEYWLYPVETVEMGTCDCEDGAILIASMLYNALPPSEHWRVRVAAGWVKSGQGASQGGHAYCTYCRETDNEWVALDWCYLEDSHIEVPSKTLLKNRQEYKEVWFSTTYNTTYQHETFDLAGRLKHHYMIQGRRDEETNDSIVRNCSLNGMHDNK